MSDANNLYELSANVQRQAEILEQMADKLHHKAEKYEDAELQSLADEVSEVINKLVENHQETAKEQSALTLKLASMLNESVDALMSGAVEEQLSIYGHLALLSSSMEALAKLAAVSDPRYEPIRVGLESVTIKTGEAIELRREELRQFLANRGASDELDSVK